MLNYVVENAKEYETTYGKVSSQSVGAILAASSSPSRTRAATSSLASRRSTSPSGSRVRPTARAT